MNKKKLPNTPYSIFRKTNKRKHRHLNNAQFLIKKMRLLCLHSTQSTVNIESRKRQPTLLSNKHCILQSNLKHPTDCIMSLSLSNFQHQLFLQRSTCHWVYSRLYSLSIQRQEGPHWTPHEGEAQRVQTFKWGRLEVGLFHCCSGFQKTTMTSAAQGWRTTSVVFTRLQATGFVFLHKISAACGYYTYTALKKVKKPHKIF